MAGDRLLPEWRKPIYRSLGVRRLPNCARTLNLPALKSLGSLNASGFTSTVRVCTPMRLAEFLRRMLV